MVVTKRAGDFSDSNSDDVKIQLRDQTLIKMRDDDVEAMIRRRKKLKTTTTTTSKSERSPGSKMCWSKDDELVILGETKSSYRSDWNGFYHSIKDYIDAKFSKQQLVDKVKTLKRKFTSNQGRAKDGNELSFTNTHDDEVFKLSMIIWGTKDEPQYCGSNEKMDQAKQEEVSIETNNGDQKEKSEEEKDGVDELCEKQDTLKSGISSQSLGKNGEKEKNEEEDGVYELCDKQDTLKSGTSFQNLSKNGEKKKSEENGEDELGVLQEALKADTLFQNLSKYQQKLLLQNLEKLEADKRKKLTDECKALFAEELQLNIKKLTFSAKLAMLLE